MSNLPKIAAAGLLLFSSTSTVSGHGLLQNPPARNWFCGAVTKPDHVINGVAQYPVCSGAFASDFSGGYSFMSVLTHGQGRAVVSPLPQNVCGFNSETWRGRQTPWDQPINWPTTTIAPGPRTFSWNISWGPHYSDTEEFRYWITKPGFQFQVGKPLAWTDFEDTAFCTLKYSDTNPNGNPNVIPDKANAMFHTQCTVPQRQGRHVIYAEWGRNQWTFERFHGCVDVVFSAGAPDFSLSAGTSLSVVRGASVTAPISIVRTDGFTGSVTLTATGLPNGINAAFNPASADGGASTLTLTASSSTPIGQSTIKITGNSGTISRTTTLTLNVAATSDFSLSTSPTTQELRRGASASIPVTINRIGGFNAPIALSASALPAGVSAVFDPVMVEDTDATMTLIASASAAIGPTAVIITGTGGAVSRTAQVNVNVVGAADPPFTLSISPGDLKVTQGLSGSATLTIMRNSGFSGTVAFSASELPVGLSAVFNPSSTNGGNTTVTLSASSSAITGAASMIVTGTSGGATARLTVPIQVTAPSGPGTLSITPIINVNQPWYSELGLKLSNTAPITQLSITINIQKTAGVNYAGQYNTVGGQIEQSNTSSGSVISYKYNLAPGQALGVQAYRMFAAQVSGAGMPHPTSGDTFSVTYTIGGTTFTETGHF